MKKITRYPTYDVMNEQQAWDEHTRQIVTSRLRTKGGFTFLTLVEAETVRAWVSLLLDDFRPEVIQFVLDHIDSELKAGRESQRSPGAPTAPELVRGGLHALDTSCQHLHTARFFHLDEPLKKQLMQDISQGEAEPFDLWKGVPQKPFFHKLLVLAIDAYYAHPEIWSQIGYGGPAYPRGYIRTDMGQLDPWEAKEEVKENESHS